MDTAAVELTAPEYVVTPSETVRNWDTVPFYKSMLSTETEEYHLYDVLTPDRQSVLEVMLVFEPDLSGSGLFQAGSVDKRLEVNTPDGEPQFTIERTGYTPTYEVEPSERETAVATFDRGLFGWTVLDDTGTDVAVAKKPITDRLLEAVSFSQRGTYVVESTDDDAIARLDETRAKGGPRAWTLSEMTVDLSPPQSMPNGIPIGLAVTLLHHGGSTSDVGGD